MNRYRSRRADVAFGLASYSSHYPKVSTSTILQITVNTSHSSPPISSRQSGTFTHQTETAKGKTDTPARCPKKMERKTLVQVQASLMQPHALFEPMLAFDLTQVGASKARCLALTSNSYDML